MSQEQLVIVGVVAPNLVLLILLITAYRLIAARTKPQNAQSIHEQSIQEESQHAQSLTAEQVQQAPNTLTGSPTEAEEIRSLEALFAHDSWPAERSLLGDQYLAPGVDGVKE